MNKEEIQNYWNSFLLSRKRLGASVHTLKQYRLDGNHLLEFIEQNEKMLEIQNDIAFEITLMKIFQEYLLEVSLKYKNENSINRKVSSLRSFVRFLFLRQIISIDFSEELERKAPLIIMLNTLTLDQERILCEAASRRNEFAETKEDIWLSLRNQCLIHLFLETGIKPIELNNMQWANIKEEGTILINYQDKQRLVKISKKLFNMLIHFKSIPHPYRLEEDKLNDYIWQGLGNVPGHQITEKTIERIFQMFSKEINFKVSATKIRYTAMTKDLLTGKSSLTQIKQKYGYAREDVLIERLSKIKKKEALN